MPAELNLLRQVLVRRSVGEGEEEEMENGVSTEEIVCPEEAGTGSCGGIFRKHETFIELPGKLQG